MKIALVHDYLTQRGGAERVFELLCQYFPEADIFTSLYNPDTTIDLSDRPIIFFAAEKISMVYTSGFILLVMLVGNKQPLIKPRF